jgi:hypothetical protein
LSVSRYYQIEQEKLLLEFEKIALFTKHNPTIGSYREQVLREYIKRLIPPQLTVKSGFVSRTDSSDEIYESQSRQIDCLIFDKSIFIPYLETEDFAVISPDSLCGCLEVKSTLTFHKKKDPSKSKKTSDDFPLGGDYQEAYRWEGTLIDALINIKCAADVSNNSKRAHFSGIVSYDANFDIENLCHAFDNDEIQRQLGLTHLRQLPLCICVPGKFVIILSNVDMFDPAYTPIPFESWFNAIIASNKDNQYPLQFMSVYIHDQVNYWLNEKAPAKCGLYSAGSARIKCFRKHFDLRSDDM